MSFEAGAITGSIALNISEFATGMLEAESISKLFPDVVTSFLANPLLGFADIAKEAISSVVEVLHGLAETIVESFKSSQEAAERLHDMAINAGVAVEALSGLSLVAENAGGNVEMVADAYRFLGLAVADASHGNAQAMALFTELGVALNDATGRVRPLSDIMLDLADAFARLPAGEERTRAAVSLLGRSGSEMIATLAQGSTEIRRQIAEFDRWGAVVSTRAAESADAWGDLINDFRIMWRGIQNAIGEPLRDALTPILKSLREYVSSHMPQIRQAVINAIATIIEKGGEVADWLESHKQDFIDIGKILLSLAEQIAEGVLIAFDTITGGVRTVQAVFRSLLEFFKGNQIGLAAMIAFDTITVGVHMVQAAFESLTAFIKDNLVVMLAAVGKTLESLPTSIVGQAAHDAGAAMETLGATISQMKMTPKVQPQIETSHFADAARKWADEFRKNALGDHIPGGEGAGERAPAGSAPNPLAPIPTIDIRNRLDQLPGYDLKPVNPEDVTEPTDATLPTEILGTLQEFARTNVTGSLAQNARDFEGMIGSLRDSFLEGVDNTMRAVAHGNAQDKGDSRDASAGDATAALSSLSESLSSGISSSFTSGVRSVVAELATMAKAINDVDAELKLATTQISEFMKSMHPPLSTVVATVTPPASQPANQTNAQTTVNVPTTIVPLNINAASSQIAQKVLPQLRQAVQLSQGRLESAARSALVGKGL